MPPKKASSDKDFGQPLRDFQRGAGMGDLEAHISERINQLHSPDDAGEEAPLGLGEELSADGVSEMIPPFEPFEGYEFATLHDPGHSYIGGYEKVRETYQESGEVTRSINNLSDLITQSLLNLNVRLSELEEKLKEINEINTSEFTKVKRHMAEVQRSILSTDSRAGAAPSAGLPDKAVAHLITELQTHMESLKDRLDHDAQEAANRIEERQSAFLSVLDTRVKVVEKVSDKYKSSIHQSFFHLAILLILIIVIAGITLSAKVDQMSSYVSHQLDALRAVIQEITESPAHPAGPE